MFKLLDSKGVQVNIKDTVEFTQVQGDMFSEGVSKEVEGIVVAILDESTVQVQPEEGASMIVPATSVTVTLSLINEVLALADSSDMEALILRAEARYEDECKNGTNKKKSTSTRKPAAPKKQGTMTL